MLRTFVVGTMLGGARAQQHLRQTLVSLNMHAINRPEVLIAFADEKIDEEGMLTDEKAKEKIRQLLKQLSDWTRKENMKLAIT